MRAKSVVVVLVLISLCTVAISTTATAQNTEPADCEFPYESSGLYGETVLKEEPEEIVTGAPSVTQILWEMEAQEKVVGVSDTAFIQYLDGINGYTNVGTAFDGSEFAEKVSTASNGEAPDVLIGSLSVQDLDKTLDPFGFEYHWFRSTGSLDGIQTQISEIGRLTGECEAAETVIQEMEQDITNVEQAVAGTESPSVLYGIPTEGFGFVPGNGTFIDDIITTAGGKNMYAENGVEGFSQIEDETAVEIVSRDPDWIVLAGGSPEDVPENDLYNSTTALRENQILVVNPNLIQQEAPRVTTPLGRMARSFHPEGFIEDVPERDSSGGAGQGIPRGMRGTEGTVGNTEESFDGIRSVSKDRTSFEFNTGPVETVEFGSVFDGDVTVTPVGVGDAPGTPIRHFRIGVPEAVRNSSATLRTTVSSSAIESVGVSVDDLVVANQVNDRWEPLGVTALETEDGATLIADTRAFSEFAVVASTPPTPVVEVLGGSDGGTVTLDGTPSSDEYGDVVSYEWTVGGENHEGERTEVPAPEGQTEISLTVTNDVGLKDTTTVTYSPQSETDVGENEDIDEGMDESDGDTATTDSEQAGFTAVATVVSVALVTLVARRRQ